jgi:hypothetical protein
MVVGEDEKSKEGAIYMIIARFDQSGGMLGAPYSVQKYKDFRNRDFDDLYEYASTPDFK